MATGTSATASLASAMSSLMLDPELADLTVTCGEKEWKVHSAVMAARSPFFKSAIKNNMVKKREMKIDIGDFDAEAMNGVIDFMYGRRIERGAFKFLFEAAERFQIDDLKQDVMKLKLTKREITVGNVMELGHLAEMYDMEWFLVKCAKFIVENDVDMVADDMSPKLTMTIFKIFKDVKQKLIHANEETKRELKDSSEELKRSQAISLDYQQKLQDCKCKKELKETYDCSFCGLKFEKEAPYLIHYEVCFHSNYYKSRY